MLILLALCALVLLMLVQGAGVATAFALWLVSLLYVMLAPSPNATFASLMFFLGLFALVVQLVLNLTGGEEKKKK